MKDDERTAIDEEIAKRVRKNTLAGVLQECPECCEVALYWNSKGNDGEGCWECLACGRTYVTEHGLVAALCNARNEEEYRDAQRFSS